jgi:hypothetical protein
MMRGFLILEKADEKESKPIEQGRERKSAVDS